MFALENGRADPPSEWASERAFERDHHQLAAIQLGGGGEDSLRELEATCETSFLWELPSFSS
jgi:hypothetical protein